MHFRLPFKNLFIFAITTLTMHTLTFKIEAQYSIDAVQKIDVLFVVTVLNKKNTPGDFIKDGDIHVRYLMSGNIKESNFQVESNSFSLIYSKSDWRIELNEKFPIKRDMDFLLWSKNLILKTLEVRFSNN